jgi:hypothetical protein
LIQTNVYRLVWNDKIIVLKIYEITFKEGNKRTSREAEHKFFDKGPPVVWRTIIQASFDSIIHGICSAARYWLYNEIQDDYPFLTSSKRQTAHGLHKVSVIDGDNHRFTHMSFFEMISGNRTTVLDASGSVSNT